METYPDKPPGNVLQIAMPRVGFNRVGPRALFDLTWDAANSASLNGSILRFLSGLSPHKFTPMLGVHKSFQRS
jgi:hypothetical protein